MLNFLKNLFKKKEKSIRIVFNIVEPVEGKIGEFNVTVIDTNQVYNWDSFNSTGTLEYYLYLPYKNTTKYKKDKSHKNVRK